MMAKTQLRAREMKTLFDRVHIVSSPGKKRGMRGSKELSRTRASSLKSSMATPDSRVRSELAALLSGRDTGRTFATVSRG